MWCSFLKLLMLWLSLTHLSVFISLILLDTYIYTWHHLIQIKISVEIILQYYFTFWLFITSDLSICFFLHLKVPCFMFLLSFSILCLNFKHYFLFNYVHLLNIYVYLSSVGSIFLRSSYSHHKYIVHVIIIINISYHWHIYRNRYFSSCFNSGARW